SWAQWHLSKMAFSIPHVCISLFPPLLPSLPFSLSSSLALSALVWSDSRSLCLGLIAGVGDGIREKACSSGALCSATLRQEASPWRNSPGDTLYWQTLWSQ